jgi:hypothetical protein
MLATIADDAAFVVKIGGVITAAIVIVRAWLWMSEITNSLQRIFRLLPTMELLRKLEPLVDVLTAEFRKNGGSTLADRVKIIAEASTVAATKADKAAIKAEEAKVATEKQDKVLEHQDQVLGNLEKSVEEIKGTVNKLACQTDGGEYSPKT